MSSITGAVSSKRGPYVRRACNECHRRRSKCDGVHPACGFCSSYGHECSWGSGMDVFRPPTKQYIETLRIKIQALENEVSVLRTAVQQLDGQRPVSSGMLNLAVTNSTTPNNIRPGPNFLEPIAAEIQPQLEYSPWLAYQAEHATSIQASTANQLLDPYQFIFNIDTSIPLAEQPWNVRQSLLCDWSLHLPSLDGVQLTRLEHDTLLDRCFKYSSSWLMSIVPQLFLNDMLHVVTHTNELSEVDHYSPLLHCSLLAFATALSDNALIYQPSTRERFATRAKQLLYSEFNQPSLSFIQALVMLSEYHFGLGEAERGYMYLGISARAIRTLGMRRESNDQTRSAAISNWYFWSVYSQEIMMALESNRDPAVRPADYGSRLPLVDPEIDCQPWFLDINAVLGIELERPNRLTQVFAQSCQLMLIAEAIIQLHQIHTSQPPVEKGNQTFDIHFRLQDWFDRLPVELTVLEDSLCVPFPHIIMMNVCYWWLVLRLYQPFLEVQLSSNTLQPFGDLPSLLCVRAAHEIMSLTQLYGRWHGLRFFPRSIVQMLFTVGHFFLGKRNVSWLDGVDDQQQPNATAAAIECVTTLRAISQTWHNAEKCADQLQAILHYQDQELFSYENPMLFVSPAQIHE